MELLYVWVQEYKNISDQGFNFSPEYRFNYKSLKNELQIGQGTALPPNFWGENVSNLTLLLGKNGAGKTSVLEIIKRPYVPKNAVYVFLHDHKIIIRYKFENHPIDTSFRLEIEGIGHQMPKQVKIGSKKYDLLYENMNNEGYSGDLTKGKASFKDLNTVYYSPIFRGDFDFKEIVNGGTSFGEVANKNKVGPEAQDLSTDAILETIIKGYRNLDKNDLLKPFENFKFKETFSQIDFLNKNMPFGRDIFKKRLPDIEVLPISDFENIFLNDDNLKQIEEILATVTREVNSLSNDTERFVFNCTLGLTKAILSVCRQAQISQIVFEVKNLKWGTLNLTAFYDISTKIVNKAYTHPVIRKDFITLIKRISERYSSYIQDNGELIQFPSSKIGELYDFLESFENNSKILFNLRWTGLSSGEMYLLNLFSRIDSGFYHQDLDFIFCIDEGETTLHPHWQKFYIRWIIELFPKMFPENKMQFVITSNNPIIATDVPSRNTIRLTQDREHIFVNTETFGSNIFDLLKDSFFVQDGFMGEFAKDKINKTVDWLYDPKRKLTQKEKDHHLAIILMVGEPVLKEKLLEMYEKVTKSDFQLRMIQKKIKELQQLENQLKSK